MSNNLLLHSLAGKSPIFGESFAGSDCNGSDGATNRVLTTSDVTNANGEITVFVDGQFLRKTDEYTVSGNDVTFLFKIWNEQKIDVRYTK